MDGMPTATGNDITKTALLRCVQQPCAHQQVGAQLKEALQQLGRLDVGVHLRGWGRGVAGAVEVCDCNRLQAASGCSTSD